MPFVQQATKGHDPEPSSVNHHKLLLLRLSLIYIFLDLHCFKQTTIFLPKFCLGSLVFLSYPLAQPVGL